MVRLRSAVRFRTEALLGRAVDVLSYYELRRCNKRCLWELVLWQRKVLSKLLHFSVLIASERITLLIKIEKIFKVSLN